MSAERRRLTDSFQYGIIEIDLAVKIGLDGGHIDVLVRGFSNADGVDIFTLSTRTLALLLIQIDRYAKLLLEIIRGPRHISLLITYIARYSMCLPSNFVAIEDKARAQLALDSFGVPDGLDKATLLITRSNRDL
jgi:hypothetical protein